MDLNLSILHNILLKEIILNGYSPNIETLSKIFQRSDEDIIQCLNDLQQYHGVVLHLKYGLFIHFHYHQLIFGLNLIKDNGGGIVLGVV
jgi:hypothetical protein